MDYIKDNFKEFDECMEKLRVVYARQVGRANYFHEKLNKYSEDDEIAKRDEEIEYLRRHSLLVMSDRQKEDSKQFMDQHYQKCKNHGEYLYRLVGTGIGTCITITCPRCNESKDITDIDSW